MLSTCRLTFGCRRSAKPRNQLDGTPAPNEMGKGRDKRRKHEDPTKVAKRAEKQAAKLAKGQNPKAAGVDAADGTNLGGLNNEEDVAVLVARIKKMDAKRRSVEEVDIPHPAPRANAGFVKHPTRDHEVVFFGGEVWDGEVTQPFNDLLVYNLQKKQWRQIKSPLGPSPRSSCQLFAYKHYIYVHGGEFVSPTQSQYLHFRDCFRFDTNTCVWEALAAGGKGAGPCPSARSGHRVALWKRAAVLFGGFYDNALETRYFDDLWVLTGLEADGAWTQVMFPPHTEKPHPRSGHTVAVHNDEFFLYGGFYTNKVNRFQRAEATVFHDLWSVDLAAPTPMWTKIRLAGIPPPIRAGVGAAVHNRRIVFFGGVVDVDGPGGRTLSNFTNDLFVFHMDSKKFFPLLLKKATGANKATKDAPPAKAAGGDLASEVAAVLGNKLRDDATSSDDDDEDDFGDKAPLPAGIAEPELKTSAVTGPDGEVLPCPRMNPMLMVLDHTLFVFGGQFEAGKKEVTLCDTYTLNLNRLDGFNCHYAQDLTKLAWKGAASEGTGSWEDGSTVMDVDAMNADDDDEEDSSSEDGAAPELVPADGGDDDDDAGPQSALAAAIAKANDMRGATLGDVDARVNVKGKASLQKHKLQLEQQLAVSSTVPAPVADETAPDFFERTKLFWMQQAADCQGVPLDGIKPQQERSLRRAAVGYCKTRYKEAIVLMEQLRTIEAQLAEEQAVLRAHLEARRKAREAEESDDAEDAAGDEGPSNTE